MQDIPNTLPTELTNLWTISLDNERKVANEDRYLEDLLNNVEEY